MCNEPFEIFKKTFSKCECYTKLKLWMYNYIDAVNVCQWKNKAMCVS